MNGAVSTDDVEKPDKDEKDQEKKPDKDAEPEKKQERKNGGSG